MIRDRFLIGYSTGNFGKNLVLGSFDLTLTYIFTDLLAIPAPMVSRLMLVVFLGDLGFDLGVGLLISYARRWGVGYPAWVFCGAVPCGLAFAFLYALPALHIRHFALIAGAILAFRAAYAIQDVPHNTLLAGVAPDSHARSRVAGYRFIFSTAASLVIAGLVTPIVQAAAHGRDAAPIARLGIAVGAALIFAMSLAAWSSRTGPVEPVAAARRSPAVLPRLDGLYLAMAVVGVVTGFATPMFGRMVIYLTTYVLRAPGLAPNILTAIIVGQALGSVLWIALSRRQEKTVLLAMSHITTAVGLSLFALCLADPRLCLACAALAGIGFSGVFMLPWAIVADIVDFAEFRYGERRETAAFALFLVIVKASSAGAAAFIAWTLGQLGYRPLAAQTPVVLAGIEALALAVPVCGAVIATFALLRMPITHRRHGRIVSLLQRRRLSSAP